MVGQVIEQTKIVDILMTKGDTTDVRTPYTASKCIIAVQVDYMIEMDPISNFSSPKVH